MTAERILLGNAVGFTGALIMVAVGLIKTKRNILLAQSLQCLIMGLGNLILGGVTGFVSNMITIARNLAGIRWKFDLKLKIIFIALQVACALTFSTHGALDWLPIAAASLFTWFMDTTNTSLLKFVIILTSVFWSIYDFALHNYTAFTMDLFTIFSNTAGIWRLRKDMGREAPEDL